MMTRRLPSLLGSALLLTLSLTACGDDGTGPDAGSAPPLPPLTSMSTDMSFFGSSGGGGAAGPHFNNAALRVFAAQVITVAHLAVPVAVFAAAANNTPTFEDDGLWHWRFSAVHGGATFVAHLSGRVEGTDVVWSMAITAPNHDPPLEDFVWYGGRGRVDRSSGTWTFFDPRTPGASNALLSVDWTHTSATDHGWVATALAGDSMDDTLSATVDGDDHMLVYVDASEGTTVEIYWNAADGSGYLIAPGYNGGVQSCWDSNQDDVPCA